MDYNKILEAIAQRKKGTMMRICYKTKPSLSAPAKKAGYVVEKITETTVRWGVRYSNMKKVIAQRTQDIQLGLERKDFKPWWSWEKEYVIKQHCSKPDKYLTVACVPKGHNTVSKYYVNGQEVTCEQLKSMGLLVPSYWTEKDLATYDININNIIEIKPKTKRYMRIKK
jgi:hypothetical protein